MPVKLPDSRQALADYLDEMLHQATSSAAGEAPLAREKPRPAFADAEKSAAASGRAPEVPAELAASPDPGLEFPLQCLMFRVGGHLLSVPLIRLHSVVDWSDAITRLPESPRWLLGLRQHRDCKLRIVDSRQLLEIDADTPAEPAHLLVLEESDWAITCDRLEQVVNLDRDDVQWKAQGSKPMVMGTIRESLATLLNPPGIRRELDSRAAPAAAAK